MLRQWGNELVVYNCHTGDTHLLEELASQVFLLLNRQTASSKVVTDHIAAHFSLVADEDLIAEVREILENLASLGVVQES